MHSRVLNDKSSVLVTELSVFGNYLDNELCAHQCDMWTRVLRGGLTPQTGNRAEEQTHETTSVILMIRQMYPNGVVSLYG